MNDLLCIITITSLTIYIIASYFRYSSEGDLNNSIKGIDKLFTEGKKDAVIKRLFNLIILNQSSVRWPYLMALSIIFSFFIAYSMGAINPESSQMVRFIIIFPLVFLPLYGTFNFSKAHGAMLSWTTVHTIEPLNRKVVNFIKGKHSSSPPKITKSKISSIDKKRKIDKLYNYKDN